MADMHLIPLASDVCQTCGGDHASIEPHNPQSLYWQTKRNLEGLPPATWEDAIAHCPADIKEAWEKILKEQYGFGCPQCGGWKFNKDDYICEKCRA